MLGGKKLVSVSALLNKFKNKFDSDTFSKKAAEKRGVTQQVILDEWKDKANKSIAIGNAIHKIFEDYVEKKYSLQCGELCFDVEVNPEYFLEFNAKKQAAISFIKDFFETGRLIPVAVEFIVYSDEIAGRADIKCVDKLMNEYIFDVKTGVIESNSFGKKMLSPLNNINDCSLNHNTLQLNLFSKMSKTKIKGTYILHIQDNYNLIEVKDIIGELTIPELIKAYKL